MFECLVGYPPFCSESTHETYHKIIRWPEYLMFPDDVHLSREAEDLIRRSVHSRRNAGYAHAKLSRLITSPDHRLGVEQIKHHPFFYGVNWTGIRNIDAPFIPRLRSITDTSYFPTDELEQVPDEPVGGDTAGASKDLAFLGYACSLRQPVVQILTRNRLATPSSGSQFRLRRSDHSDRGNRAHLRLIWRHCLRNNPCNCTILIALYFVHVRSNVHDNHESALTAEGYGLHGVPKIELYS